MNTSTLVLKVWSDCRVLRDDGMSYGDCVEQLTSLLRLKRADERAQPPFNLDGCQPSNIPKACAWPSLLARHGDDVFDHDRHALGQHKGKLGIDVKGDACEGLLDKNAQDAQSGAGQCFTPRTLIQATGNCIATKAGERVCDPACGTGGFRFTAFSHVPLWSIVGDPVAQP